MDFDDELTESGSLLGSGLFVLSSISKDQAKSSARRIPNRASAGKIALGYILLSAIWVASSGWVLHHFVHNQAWLPVLETVKGWFFVLVTGLLLWLTLDRVWLRISRFASELQESEQKYREIFDATNDAILLHDAETGYVLDVNDATLRMHGYESKEELFLHQAEHLFTKDSRCSWAEAQERIRKAVKEGPQVFEWVNRKKSGEPFWVEVSLRSSNVAGKGRVLAVVREVTERKNTQAALRQAEASKKAVLDSVTSHIAVLDRNGVIVAVNEPWNAFARANLGNVQTSGDVWIGADYLAICRKSQGNSSEGALAAHEGIQAVLDGRRPDFVLEYPCDSPWEKRWFSMVVSPLGKDGEGVVVSHTNITERKVAEAAVHETNERLKKVLEVETVGVMFWEMPTGVLINANDSFLKLMGYTRSEVEARELTWQKLTLPEFFEISQEELRKFEATGRVGPYEKQYRRKDGTAQWLLFAGTRLDPHTIVEFCVDISAQKTAEAALWRSEKKHRALYESSRDAILTVDPVTRKFTSGNPAALELFRVNTAAELLAFGPADFSPELQPDGRRSCEALLEVLSTVKEKGSHFFEWKHRRLNSEEFHANVLLTWIEWDGKTAIMATVRDISTRKEAEERLRESEQRFRALVETAPEAIFVRTGQRFTYVNDAALTLFGASSAEKLLGHDVLERFQANCREQVAAGMNQLDKTGKRTIGSERVLLKLDGSEIDVSISAVPITFQGNQSALVFAQDISDRKRAEAAFAQQFNLQNRLAKIAESVPGAIYSFQLRPDGSMAMPYATAALERIFGVTPEQVREDASPILALIHPDDVRQVNESIRISAQTHTAWHREFRGRSAARGEIWIEGHSVPQLEPDGSVLWHGFLRDITERKQLEAQLRQSQKLEGIGQLAGGVAHDFSNILAAMMMQVDLSSMGEGVPDDVRAGLKEIRAAIDRAASLTRQLLLFSRKQVLQPRDIDLNEVVTSLAKMLQRVIREDVRLQLNLHTAPLITYADEGMLHQVLMNLAVNARDAMPEGGQLVIDTSERTFDLEGARIHPDAAPGRYVSLSVTDTGTGMSPEIISRIFEPFFTTKEPGKGTGLGLATVFGIVKQHKGWINVQSEPGKGASFQVYLPASERTVVGAPNAAEPGFPGGTETIFLVEDENSVRRVTRMLLERQGYTVFEATNGIEAVQSWKQNRDKISLLLTDLVMPSGMTGQELARKLRADKPGLKVIYTSGYSAEVAGCELHLSGDEKFLQKPCPPALLLQTIRKALQS